MNIATIAWKSLRQRALASILTAFSVALGIMLMVIVLVLYGIVEDNFGQRSIGYDLIVGPKGSDLQLVLSTVYRLNNPDGVLPYRFYTELQKDPQFTELVPITMGDVTEEGGFKIIGTTGRYFEIGYGPDKPFTVTKDSKRFGTPFDAIIGIDVARTNNWTLGSKFKLVHGAIDNKEEHTHDEEFTVVAILERTGTANDKTVFVNIDGFFAIGGHDKPLDEAIAQEIEFFGNTTLTPAEIERLKKLELEEAAAHSGEGEGEGHGHHHHHHETPDIKKNLSAIFVQTRTPMVAAMLEGKSKRGSKAMYVNPVRPIDVLMKSFVGNVRNVLLILTTMIVIVSGVGIFVSIYNSMADRKREIGIMRALGASRGSVFSIICAESILLCVCGGLLGLVLGHGIIFATASTIETQTGILVDPFAFEPIEAVLFPILIGFAALIGFIPGMTAYRTDVAEALSS